MTGFTYVDADGREVYKGLRVLVGDEAGEIVGISAPDADMEEGRFVAIAPRVTVRFLDGMEDSFSGTWTARGPNDEDAPYRFDDITVTV